MSPQITSAASPARDSAFDPTANAAFFEASIQEQRIQNQNMPTAARIVQRPAPAHVRTPRTTTTPSARPHTAHSSITPSFLNSSTGIFSKEKRPTTILWAGFGLGLITIGLGAGLGAGLATNDSSKK